MDNNKPVAKRADKEKIKRITVTAVLSAAGFCLMLLEFPIPFLIPAFVKMDLSELPALLAAFSYGPWHGLIVCLIKNLLHLPMTQSGGIGEFCSFLLGCWFVLPAENIYGKMKSKKGALLGCAVGAICMAALSFPLNFYWIYPIYAKVYPIESIMAAYQKLIPSMDSLEKCLLVFNAPFTLLKGAIDTVLVFAIYPVIRRYLD